MIDDDEIEAVAAAIAISIKGCGKWPGDFSAAEQLLYRIAAEAAISAYMTACLKNWK